MYILGFETLLVAVVVSFLATPAVIWLANRVGALDRPDARKIHRVPVPRLGGVAVYAGFSASILFAGFASGYLGRGAEPRLGYWLTLGGAATAVFLLGVADDVRGVSWRTKFVVQIAAALVVWVAGFRIEAVSHPFAPELLRLGWIGFPVTLLWIVGITNAVNLIDGLDGLATGTALITTVAVAVVAFHMGQPGVVGFSVALVGSLAGFLWFNFNPARIFLGDSGSMFLGFLLAVVSIHGSQKGPTAVATLAPLLVLGLPILDTSLAVLRRLYRLGKAGRSSAGGWRYVARNVHHVFLPDRSHLHHRLLEIGLSHRSAVVLLYGAGILLALAALALVIVRSVLIASILLAVLAVAVVALLVSTRKKSPPSPDEPGGHAGVTGIGPRSATITR